jgi:hypothetical protein
VKPLESQKQKFMTISKEFLDKINLSYEKSVSISSKTLHSFGKNL